MAKRDANDVASESGADGLRKETEARVKAVEQEQLDESGWKDLDLIIEETGGKYRPYVIERLLRRGETMNVIAPSKVGKSFLVLDMLLSVITGQPWLHDKWQCHKGRVAIIDNELHQETIGARGLHMIDARGLPRKALKDLLYLPLRGHWKDIHGISDSIMALRSFGPDILVLDALYRFVPEGKSENDNAAMAQVYNQIDRYGEILMNCAIIVVHHSSKGAQWMKATMDVGSGAGSMGRAADVHLALREHESEKTYIVQARTRTWDENDDFCIKWGYPTWKMVDDDPQLLAGSCSKKSNHNVAPATLDDAAFATCLNGQWMSKTMTTDAVRRGLKITGTEARRLVEEVIARHKLEEMTSEDGPKRCGDVFIAELGNRGNLRFTSAPQDPDRPLLGDAGAS